MRKEKSMNREEALVWLNMLLNKQHIEYRMRMNYLARRLGWNRPTRMWPRRGKPPVFY